MLMVALRTATVDFCYKGDLCDHQNLFNLDTFFFRPESFILHPTNTEH